MTFFVLFVDFKYKKHLVMEVGKENYDDCNSTQPARLFKKIPLHNWCIPALWEMTKDNCEGNDSVCSFSF